MAPRFPTRLDELSMGYFIFEYSHRSMHFPPQVHVDCKLLVHFHNNYERGF
jgi:hypothetical protein